MLLGAAVFVPAPWWVRAAFAAFGLVAAFAQSRSPGSARASSGHLIADGSGIVRSDASGATSPLLRWGGRFGVTVLTNPRWDRGLLAFTSAELTRYVPVRVAEGAPQEELFARASTLPDADLVLAAGDDPAAIDARDALELLRLVERRAPGALERIHLTDFDGAPICLDDGELRVGERVLDLRAPLEWRAFTFHEEPSHPGGGTLTMLYQATWVRQAGCELVLVAPVPAELPLGRPEVDDRPGPLRAPPSARGAVARDLRLMQSCPDAPPPRELRTAIDRLFMLPLRRALDRAPLAARSSNPGTSRPRPEGRA